MPGRITQSFFNLLKLERVRRRLYRTRNEVRKVIFDYIEMFFNPKRKYLINDILSPIDYEQHKKKLKICLETLFIFIYH